MKFVFFGTPQFAVNILSALIKKDFWPSLVITQPDKPQGRSGKLISSPVKKFARENNMEVLQPLKLDEIFRKRIEPVNPEMIIVVAYGKILPVWLINLPSKGCLNLHASILPAYRGAAPIQRAILEGETKTGITIMLMDEGMDTGPILSQQTVSVAADDTCGSLSDKLAEKGAILLIETIKKWMRGRIIPHKQSEKGSSLAPKIEKEERIIDWSQQAGKIKNKIRALNPNPGAFTYYREKILKIWVAEVISIDDNFTPGEVLESRQELIVATGKKALRLDQVQPEGKKKMSGHQFLIGHPFESGEKLGC